MGDGAVEDAIKNTVDKFFDIDSMGWYDASYRHPTVTRPSPPAWRTRATPSSASLIGGNSGRTLYGPTAIFLVRFAIHQVEDAMNPLVKNRVWKIVTTLWGIFVLIATVVGFANDTGLKSAFSRSWLWVILGIVIAITWFAHIGIADTFFRRVNKASKD